MKRERDGYRWMKNGLKTHMTPERALKLTEIGFCWDVSQYRGANRISNKKRNHAEEDEEEETDMDATYGYDHYGEMS